MAPVYPRWRGEHALRSRPAVTDCGLSPLARGTPCSLHPYKPSLRFIPAGAGNTSATTSNQLGFTVYPRWRGEHSQLLWCPPNSGGLSPLARGTRWLTAMNMRGKRFIPAGAGNTITAWLFGRRTPVYPRWRGEHWLYPLLFAIKHGLSPLARGTHRIRSGGAGRDRFIPAGAGNTLAQNAWLYICAVYPRWRGEHLVCNNPSSQKYGLSPLARGTHAITEDAQMLTRFIPAGAGNTR
ncbi:Domain of uncharacterised function (DUF2825) [Klebsiella pneumoniae]|nr:Domain of uncharacterised function (DUF2825) [Klebsiella pneumoniae]SYS57676.1 Domain of uncharacterised function (DUF2825) [Klebsiella pneumoniae]